MLDYQIASKFFYITNDQCVECYNKLNIMHHNMELRQLPIVPNNLMKHEKKYIPSPEAAEIIMSYFIFNNFQDFNTWQQIARTKSQYEYMENNRGMYECKMTLKWQERNLPGISKVSEGKNKKEAKKKTMQRMIEDLIYQGYIGYGFKEEDFVKRIPRRRKEDSEQSQESQKSEDMGNNNGKMKQLLIEKKFEQALKLMNVENISEIWHYGLGKCDVSLCVRILKQLQGGSMEIEQQQLSVETKQWQVSCENQIDESMMEDTSEHKNVWNPLQEDLTDFLHLYQLQCEKKVDLIEEQKVVQKLELKPLLLPSQTILNKMNGEIRDVTRDVLLSNFYPIGARLQLQNKQHMDSHQQDQSSVNSFFKLPYQLQLPLFQGDTNKHSYKTIENLYDGLLFYAHHYNFALKIAIIIFNTIKQCKIQNSSYYLTNKHLLLTEFLCLLHRKTKTLNQVTLEGMVTQITGKSAYTLLTFVPKEPEEIINRKISKKNNTNQFQQLPTISNNQYVLLISKLNPQERYIAYIQQITPLIKIVSPSLPYELNVPHPYVMHKLTNAKLYQKISSALLQISKHSLNKIQKQAYILYQPVTYTRIGILIELICQLMYSQDMILLISNSIDYLHSELVTNGLKCLKITPKFDQKQVSKYQIICSSPNAVCSQVLKNYAFGKVIMDDAHNISQVMCLMALSKGCNKLFLIGDINLPRARVVSSYCKKLGMDCSLMERLIKNGHKFWTYFSEKENYFYHHSILQWCNQQYYNSRLVISHNQTPIIKGFIWPNKFSRIALIHTSEPKCQIKYQINVLFSIIFQILKTGFMNFNQICCLVGSYQLQHFLSIQLTHFLANNFQQLKITQLMISKSVKIIDGSKSEQENDLCIALVNEEWQQKWLIGSFFYGSRGLIYIGDLEILKDKKGWDKFIKWANQNKIVLKYH